LVNGQAAVLQIGQAKAVRGDDSAIIIALVAKLEHPLLLVDAGDVCRVGLAVADRAAISNSGKEGDFVDSPVGSM
jgi:hypothetical protein